MRFILATVLSALSLQTFAQTCDCEKEFLYIKKVIEQNFAGYPDRVKSLGKKVYQQKIKLLQRQTHNKFASDNCPLIIDQYLGLFKSNHLGFSNAFDALAIDTAYSTQRPLVQVSEEQLQRLRQSNSWEGIYYFVYDSSYKIAVIKDPTPLHDYIGVLLESKLTHWKRGMLKFEGKLVNDSLLFGLLYVRNHRPKREHFGLNENNNKIGGDWRREGAVKPEPVQRNSNSENPPPVFAKMLSPNTLYLKILSFDTDYKHMLDSVLKANETLLNTTPNLVLDLQDNGGGSDNLWKPLIPYLYTNPIRSTGVDILATPVTIAGWKKYLEDENISDDNRTDIKSQVDRMEKAKGKWLNMVNDQVDSSYKPKTFPQKIVILINKWCGSSTEEFLLAARQSSKVILTGQTTIGNLDYSNVVETKFSCFPYTLRYASTRSRRLNAGKGIDNIGIAPLYRFGDNDDWIKEALRILEQ